VFSLLGPLPPTPAPPHQQSRQKNKCGSSDNANRFDMLHARLRLPGLRRAMNPFDLLVVAPEKRVPADDRDLLLHLL
jgi:hypothetical protein